MINVNRDKVEVLNDPGVGVATNNTTVFYVDKEDYEYVEFLLTGEKATASGTNQLASCVVQYSDDASTWTTFADGTGTTNTTATTAQFLLPSHTNTSVGSQLRIGVDARNAKGRYIGVMPVSADATDDVNYCVSARKSRGTDQPNTNDVYIDGV